METFTGCKYSQSPATTAIIRTKTNHKKIISGPN